LHGIGEKNPVEKDQSNHDTQKIIAVFLPEFIVHDLDVEQIIDVHPFGNFIHHI
jgi:hypothetical protein